jgi:hypothetical protein
VQGKARHYRERLSAAEARGFVPESDMATLPVVVCRSATPTGGGREANAGAGAGASVDAAGDRVGGAEFTGRLSTGRMTPANVGGGEAGGGGGDLPAGRGYREAMQDKFTAAQVRPTYSARRPHTSDTRARSTRSTHSFN